MKTNIIFLFLLSILFVSCKKENNNPAEHKIIVGGVYLPYTGLVQSSTNGTINISDTIYQFNKIEGIYYSHKPSSNQNVFIMTFDDTLNKTGKECATIRIHQTNGSIGLFSKKFIAC